MDAWWAPVFDAPGIKHPPDMRKQLRLLFLSPPVGRDRHGRRRARFHGRGLSAHAAHRGGVFDVVELWIENGLMFEVLTPDMQDDYQVPEPAGTLN
jgi:hypothetical protein